MNPIKVIKARKHQDFQEIIGNADWVFPDAWGMKWAASLLYGENIPLCPGYKVMFSLIEQAGRDNHSIYLLGTTEEVLKIANHKLLEIYPKLQIVGGHHGFFSESDERTIFQNIAKVEPHYVFVAMGEYKQEKIIQKLRPLFPKAVYMGVGGSIDLIAGKQPSPPRWLRKNHLEWLFRLILQPSRAPRFKALPIFAFLVILEKVNCLLKTFFVKNRDHLG